MNDQIEKSVEKNIEHEKELDVYEATFKPAHPTVFID